MKEDVLAYLDALEAAQQEAIQVASWYLANFDYPEGEVFEDGSTHKVNWYKRYAALEEIKLINREFGVVRVRDLRTVDDCKAFITCIRRLEAGYHTFGYLG